MVNNLNKIFIDNSVSISNAVITSLLFDRGLLKSKSTYSILDHYLNLLEPTENHLNLYITRDTFSYYEFNKDISQEGSTITGKDIFNNTLSIDDSNVIMLFINGYKIQPVDYEVINNTIYLKDTYGKNTESNIIVLLSNNITYHGQINTNFQWNSSTKELQIDNYLKERYIFFINGQLINQDFILVNNNVIKFNIPITEYDIIEYYSLNNLATALSFDNQLGALSYGTTDKYSIEVPVIYDTLITIDGQKAKYAIDNIRSGFFLEEVSGSGKLLIIEDDFETFSMRAITITSMSNVTYNKDEFYLVVPEARSITTYLSEFDIKQVFLPEVLGVFQKLLLNETYDTIQRMKNIRSINNVDSNNLPSLIKFLGMDINITNLDINRKHRLLEELSNFYSTVGTRSSYNFFNIGSTQTYIQSMEQLYTPIKDQIDNAEEVKRYVTFKTAGELGAVTKREYIYPKTEYGRVGVLANPTDSFTNMPRNNGILENPEYPFNSTGKQLVYIINELGEAVLVEKTVLKNKYIIDPVIGPNKININYGSISSEPTSFINYGTVTEKILGKWIEWVEWDRPSNWYPTNHVNMSLEVPVEMDYETFSNEFKNTFYNIASSVLYIHSIIQLYTFGTENNEEAVFGIMTSPTYHTIEHTFTSDASIQI